jgi:hypothetical protein
LREWRIRTLRVRSTTLLLRYELGSLDHFSPASLSWVEEDSRPSLLEGTEPAGASAAVEEAIDGAVDASALAFDVVVEDSSD